MYDPKDSNGGKASKEQNETTQKRTAVFQCAHKTRECWRLNAANLQCRDGTELID